MQEPKKEKPASTNKVILFAAACIIFAMWRIHIAEADPEREKCRTWFGYSDSSCDAQVAIRALRGY
jgi:hypothetical protein